MNIFAALIASACVTLTADNTEIVVEKGAPKTVRFAAEELRTFLSQVFSSEVPQVQVTTAGKTHIYLGECEELAKAGFSTKDLPRDAFILAVKDGDVYIAGRDDPKIDIKARIDRAWWASHKYERSTLNGVYTFLERAAGVRFYFAGELGTCVPRRKKLRLPEGSKIVAPDMRIRTWSYYTDGKWPEPLKDPKYVCPAEKALNVYRLRASSSEYTCCHGLNGFRILDRFKDSHPEYFALLKDGTRADHVINGPWDVGHLCYSSAVKDVIVEDCLAFLRGESAESRGIKSNYYPGKYSFNHGATASNIDLMPQDGWHDCQCEKCAAARRPEGEKARSTELVWGFAADVARRLKEKGFEPVITMMSYSDYADIPRIELPTNIVPMVALTGPWAHSIEGRTDDDVKYLKRWREKLKGGRPWIWTYPNKDKCNGLNLPGIPSFAPRAWGAYFKAVAPEVMGIFTESECDKFLNNALGYYVVQKICWNRNTNVEAVIDEFYEKMFGEAASPMQCAMEILEDKFVKDIAGDQAWTPVGPKANRPSEYRLWTEIYSAQTTKKLEDYFDEAARAVAPESIEARRVALFRETFFDEVKSRGEKYRKSIDVPSARAHFDAAKVNLAAQKWSFDRSVVTEDTNKRVVGDYSFRIDTTEKNSSRWSLFNKLSKDAKLRPGVKYRLSWFARTDLSPRQRGGGFAMSISFSNSSGYKKSWLFPNTFNYLSGKVEWIHQSGEFTLPADAPADLSGCIMPFVRYAVGSAWIDGVLLEEVE